VNEESIIGQIKMVKIPNKLPDIELIDNRMENLQGLAAAGVQDCQTLTLPAKRGKWREARRYLNIGNNSA
jgi:hypothetical protein